jgi:two-component system chemotaxis response regulator CheB
MTKKIRVLVVDDSALVRKALLDIFASDPQIEVMAAVGDPILAAQRMRSEVPDVITLDIEMPRMDGLTFLDKIMKQHPIPVVICSTLTEAGSQTALDALERGAVEIITKPKLGTAEFFRESAIRICDAVKAAAQVRLKKRRHSSPGLQPKLSADAILAPPRADARTFRTTDRVVAIGASTGGTEALSVVLQALPVDCPGVVIVQHMPEKFTASFAARLDALCAIRIKEAADGDPVLPGQALIAQGNQHMLLKRSGARYFVEVRGGPLVSRHRPAVDVLFRSTARYAGANAVGVILTGMGDDGARGMLELKESGAFNIAQDEESCVVFGMPQAAFKLGGIDLVLPLTKIPAEILRRAS